MPLFVMVSGMLLLTEETVAESPLVFYRRRASRIAIPLLAWTLLYRLYPARCTRWSGRGPRR